jgi:hypothetical protein
MLHRTPGLTCASYFSYLWRIGVGEFTVAAGRLLVYGVYSPYSQHVEERDGSVKRSCYR